MYLTEQEKEIVTQLLAYDGGTLWEVYLHLDCAPVESVISESATYITVRGHSHLLNAGEKVQMFKDPAYSIWMLDLLMQTSETLEELGMMRLYHSGFENVPSVFLKDRDGSIYVCKEINQYAKRLSSVVMLTDGLSEFVNRGFMTDQELEKKQNYDLSVSALNATKVSNDLAQAALLATERSNQLASDALKETRKSNGNNLWILGVSLILNIILTAFTIDRSTKTAWDISKTSQTMRSDSTFTISLDQKTVEALAKTLKGAKNDSTKLNDTAKAGD